MNSVTEFKPRRAPSPTRNQRRQIYALKRAGHSREQIAEQTGVPLSDVIKTIGGDKLYELDPHQPLNGTWRVLGGSGSEPVDLSAWERARARKKATDREREDAVVSPEDLASLVAGEVAS
jgi:hypothetical protein